MVGPDGLSGDKGAAGDKRDKGQVGNPGYPGKNYLTATFCLIESLYLRLLLISYKLSTWTFTNS